MVPSTLWGEIAFQIGGESLYREVEEDANSFAAPGRIYFEKVFSERKVVIMLDELAQYAARLEAARPDGASQLAAFLMALHGYARNRPGIAIILTLAGAADAFARQTEKLAELISNVQGQQVGTGAALGIGEKAVKNIASVVARDAVQVTPVQAAEISAVLTKRLFLSVDRDAAREAAEEYFSLYQRNASLLPEEATNEAIEDRMTAHYPFHPTLVDFLNKKLAGAKLSLIFRLQERILDMDRVELIARRAQRFSREEAVYWLTRATQYGDAANRWAQAGLRLMLGGQPGDSAIPAWLEKIREE